MTPNERDRCDIAVAILNPESKDRVSVKKVSAVVFRDYSVQWSRDVKKLTPFHFFRVRNYRIPVRFNGKNWQTTLKQEDYQLLFQQHERH